MHTYMYLYNTYMCIHSTSGTRAQDHTQGITNIYIYIYIFAFVYVCTYCLLLVAYCPLPTIKSWSTKRAEACSLGISVHRGAEAGVVELGLMRNGHEMLCLLRGFLLLKVISLSAMMLKLRIRTHSSKWLRNQPSEQGTTTYIYIYIHIYIYIYIYIECFCCLHQVIERIVCMRLDEDDL